MTTIAYRDGVLVGEGRETFAKRIDRDNCVKVFRLKNGSVIGVAGSSLATKSLIDVLNNALKNSNKKRTDLPKIRLKNCFALMLDGTKVYYFENGNWEDVTSVPYYAIGTGSDLAIAAMDAGATAIEAVKIACRRDIYSGGKITSMSPSED